MKKQTALDWLAQQMQHPEIFNPYIEHAKEMEKQQIMDAQECGYISGYLDTGKSGEEYYNETFNSEK